MTCLKSVNIIDFISDKSRKTDLKIAQAVTTVDIPSNEVVQLKKSEATFNPSFKYTLVSEFQLQKKGYRVDSKAIRHGG